MQWVLSLPGGGGLSFTWQNLDQEPLWKKQVPKDPAVLGKGWTLACPGQAVGSAEVEHSPCRDSILAPAPYHCRPCGTCQLCYRMGMATSGHIWAVDALVHGAGCAHACPASSPPLLPSSFPPSFTPGPMRTGKEGGTSTGAATSPSSGGNTWVRDKGLCRFYSVLTAMLFLQQGPARAVPATQPPWTMCRT